MSRTPLAWDVLVALLGSEAIPGIEVVEGRRYGRTVRLDGQSGVVFAEDAARPGAAAGGAAAAHVNVDVSPSLLTVLMPLLARLRRLFDLDAEPTVIDAHLARGGLGALIGRRPGVRIPGAVCGFEVAMRALLTGRARPGAASVARRVMWALGDPVETGFSALSRLAPGAASVARAGAAGLVALGVPRRRAAALGAIARMVVGGSLRLEPGSDAVATRHALLQVDGIGDRLATAIVMRALYWPDAFPAADRVLQRAAGVAGPAALLARAERWRPWRAYAALQLWLEAGAGEARAGEARAKSREPRDRGCTLGVAAAAQW